jgi:hypothetical protein
MSRNLLSVTMTEMTGHDAEMGGHVGPKYPGCSKMKEERGTGSGTSS